MKTIRLTLALLAASIAFASAAQAAASASVRAVLVMASKTKGPADPKLAAYEAELQRNLPESSFRSAGEGAVTVSGTGHATISLSGGHRIELDGEQISGSTIRMKVEWKNGQQPVLATSLSFQPGVPAVLVSRPSGDGDVPIVILIAK